MFDTIRRLFSKRNRPARRQPPKPRRRRPELEQLEKRDCPSAVSLVASGDWNDPNIWSTHAVPTQNDDVDLTGAFNVLFNGSVNGPTAARTVTLDALFSGTLTLNSVFTVGSGLEVDNGVINQPGGVGVSDINVSGFLN
jgi:hypothetical protein